MRSHEAGVLHAEGYGGPPLYLPYPTDVMELLPQLWPRSVVRDEAGRLTVGGVDVVTLAGDHGTAAYVLDEDDFRSRAAEFRDGFASAFEPLAGADVYYAGKAFLCTAVARWVAEEGLYLDVCTGGELAVARRAQFPPERIGFHSNTTTTDEIREALTYGVGRVVVDSFHEIDRIAAVATELGVVAPVLVRVTVGVEAHTHEFIATGHEDQKFGFSLAGGQALEAATRLLARPDVFDLRGLHSHIGSQIFDTGGFEMAARRLVGLHAQIVDEHGHHCPEIDLGGGYGIAYTSQHTPLSVATLAQEMADIVGRELKVVGGGMSDNARPALYEADYSCTLANRRSEAAPRLSRVVGRHCESGDIVVLDEYLPADVVPGDLIAVPGTGAYCRSLSSQYNHTPRPPVVAVRGGRSRVLVRRETIEDLLALDVADA